VRGALLLSLVLVAGCAALSPGAGDAVVVSRIMAETREAAAAAPGVRRTRLAEAAERYRRQPDDASRLRLAAMCVILPEPLRDDERAWTLLAPLAGRRPATPLADYAALLQAQISERRKLSEAGDRRQRSLRQQLEALRASERAMIEREERADAARAR